ncbi:MAG: RT0821/Lpp0805 family surface protein [Methyloceanibacter sp.]
MVMRAIRWKAPIIIGTGALALLLTPATLSLNAEVPLNSWAVIVNTVSAEQTENVTALRARLDRSDRAMALNALQEALSELGDGASLVWQRPSRALSGVIKTVSAFRDDEGRVCRHLTYSLSVGAYVKQVEGVACRQSDGQWSLAG